MNAGSRDDDSGRAELRAARRESLGLYWFVALFSVFVNLLMLTGPLYMLQVYDRVLGSRSVETLIALSVLVFYLFAMMGLLDYARGRIMGRVAARFQARLDRRVFDAVIRKSAIAPDIRSTTGLADLEAVQRLMAAPVLMALFDLPWTPVFLMGIWLFHPWLGMLAMAGGAVLIVIAVLNQRLTRAPQQAANLAVVEAEQVAGQIRGEAEMVQAMGMRDAAFDRWQKARARSLDGQIAAADLGGTLTTTTRAFRLFLQSAMLGLGAYLVLRGEMTAGGIIAGSILLGRALAPVEQAVGQWQMVQRAQRGWESLAELLSAVPPEAPRIALPRPRARIEAERLTVVPPGARQPSLRGIGFAVAPGQAVGVIGPSGAGKSTLARALTGVWRPAAGTIRLDGATLDQYAPEALGRHIGYLPQRVQIFDGTVAENIARMSNAPDADQVVAAARMADAHEMILRLPEGYDTPLSASSAQLSGGQLQRIGLARALYGEPVILVLDEPNSNLDNEGNAAVNAAIRRFKAQERSVLVMAHRPAAIQECDHILMLDGGAVRAFGPKEEVLRKVVQNHEQIARAGTAGGVQ